MRQDDLYPLDMLIAAHKASRFAQYLDHARLVKSAQSQSAILEALKFDSEAAPRISDGTREVNRI